MKLGGVYMLKKSNELLKEKHPIIWVLETFWGWISSFFEGLIILLMSFLVVMTFVKVFYRYVLNNPITWASELSRYLFVWITFLAAWFVFKKRGHLGLDVLVIALSESVQKVILRVGELIILVFLLFVLKITPDFLDMTFCQTSPSLGLSMKYIYASFPVFSILVIGEILLGWINPERISFETTYKEIKTNDKVN